MTNVRYDVVVVGAGHNGLVTAGYLARAGLRTLMLERRERVGGALDTVELAPGVRCPAAADTVGRLRRSVVRDLALTSHGLTLIRPDVRAFAPQPDGRAVTLWGDARRTADGLRGWSKDDADAYEGFDRRIRSLASLLAYVDVMTPPHLTNRPTRADAIAGYALGKAFTGLGPATRRELFRVLPMAVADVVGESFQTDAVRGILATRGVRYAAMGPWSAGTATVLLSDAAGGGAAGDTMFARGGPGALAEALAAAVRAFGGQIRTGVDGEVASVLERGGRAVGVAMASGEEIGARVVVSAADPKTTLLRFVDPVVLGPTLAWRARNIRTSGVVAKVNLALAGLPRFGAAGGDDAVLRGRIVVATGIDALERAFDASKYGRVSEEPYLDATIPTLSDPTLAPEGTHVMSVVAQWAPYALREGGDWEAERDRLGDLVLKTLEQYAPGISDLVTARQVVTPVDLERDYGMPGGHALHGEPSLDQWFAWRPLLGHARYRMPLEAYYLCGSGAHPGGGITGGPGANAAREILSDLKRSR